MKQDLKKGATGGAAPFISLAPLAGVSDRPFREICFAYGASGATTEMVSAQALYYENDRTAQLLEKGEEGDLVLQLFGHDPDILRQVIEERFNADHRFVAIELNMGCPAPKIVKNGDGSALMKDPEKVGRILRAMVFGSKKPIHLKMRLGWDDRSKNYLEIAKIAEDAGVSMLTLHARTREMQYSGQADWGAIAALKRAVSIPVIGNGDVRTPEDAKRLFDETGCDGIAIGRGAMGKPFLFRQIREFLQTGRYEAPAIQEVIATLFLHYKKEMALRGEDRALLEMRKHIAWYIAGYRGAAKAKAKIMVAKSYAEVEQILQDAALQ